MAVANTLAYYSTIKNTDVKSFIIHVPKNLTIPLLTHLKLLHLLLDLLPELATDGTVVGLVEAVDPRGQRALRPQDSSHLAAQILEKQRNVIFFKYRDLGATTFSLKIKNRDTQHSGTRLLLSCVVYA